MSITNAEFVELSNCRRRLLVALSDEMKHRNDDDRWVEREREAITTAANGWALNHGLQPITVADVEHIEGMAVGHVDYARKLALYISELLYGLNVQP